MDIMEKQELVGKIRDTFERCNFTKSSIEKSISQISDLLEDEKYREIFFHKGFYDAIIAFPMLYGTSLNSSEKGNPELSIYQTNNDGIGFRVNFEAYNEVNESRYYDEVNIELSIENGNLIKNQIGGFTCESKDTDGRNKFEDDYTTIQSEYEPRNGVEISRRETKNMPLTTNVRNTNLGNKISSTIINQLPKVSNIPSSDNSYCYEGKRMLRDMENPGCIQITSFEKGEILDDILYAADTQHTSISGNIYPLYDLNKKEVLDDNYDFIIRDCLKNDMTLDIDKIRKNISDLCVNKETSIYSEIDEKQDEELNNYSR